MLVRYGQWLLTKLQMDYLKQFTQKRESMIDQYYFSKGIGVAVSMIQTRHSIYTGTGVNEHI